VHLVERGEVDDIGGRTYVSRVACTERQGERALIRSGADPAQMSRSAGHSEVSTTLDLYVGEREKPRFNGSGTRHAAIYGGAVWVGSR
jgi:hypothetical protein